MTQGRHATQTRNTRHRNSPLALLLRPRRAPLCRFQPPRRWRVCLCVVGHSARPPHRAARHNDAPFVPAGRDCRSASPCHRISPRRHPRCSPTDSSDPPAIAGQTPMLPRFSSPQTDSLFPRELSRRLHSHAPCQPHAESSRNQQSIRLLLMPCHDTPTSRNIFTPP